MPFCRWLAARVPERYQPLLLNPPDRLGRRGAVLLILGLIWLMQALNVWVRPYMPPQQIHERMPMWLRVTIWAVAGAIALWAAFRRGPGKDAIGFSALIVPLLIRAFSYVWGSFTWIITWLLVGEGHGAGTSFLQAALWIGLIVLIVTIAGWPEPREPDT